MYQSLSADLTLINAGYKKAVLASWIGPLISIERPNTRVNLILSAIEGRLFKCIELYLTVFISIE